MAVLLALALGGLLAFSLTRSLRELTEATVEIARGKLGKQVKVRSRDELGELADIVQPDEPRPGQRHPGAPPDDRRHRPRPALAALSVIAGYAEALSDGKLPGTPRPTPSCTRRRRHLSRLVEDLRPLSLADAGELHAQPAALPGRAGCSSRRSLATRSRRSRRASPCASRPDGPLPAVSVDPERMAQVLDNLILNALRYTPQGGEIVLSACAGGNVEFQVRDNGSGIAAEDLPHIFNRFYRGDKARQQNGKSGLGLAIARSIVEAHGGTIGAESAPVQGSTFTIGLKTGYTEKADASRAAPATHPFFGFLLQR